MCWWSSTVLHVEVVVARRGAGGGARIAASVVARIVATHNYNSTFKKRLLSLNNR